LTFFFIEEFEDTKGVIRILNSKNRQHNCQKKKYKRTNKDLQNITHKIEIDCQCGKPNAIENMIGCEGIKGKTLCNIWKHMSCAGNKNLQFYFRFLPS
jgi:hypothetical protein